MQERQRLKEMVYERKSGSQQAGTGGPDWTPFCTPWKEKSRSEFRREKRPETDRQDPETIPLCGVDNLKSHFESRIRRVRSKCRMKINYWDGKARMSIFTFYLACSAKRLAGQGPKVLSACATTSGAPV
jgi:hypothetical protein